MFGFLNEPEVAGSLDPDDYAKSRGRFYLIWNASKISGRPMLVALMAGHAAHEAENTDTTSLLNDVNERLRKTFGVAQVPAPMEVVVTRWKRDPFTRGTYSYVGPQTRPGDYDLMAKSVGNLHFAGEATCGTHPATVHGAFLSGLRVAAAVMEAMAGPISLPDPLVGPPAVKSDTSAGQTVQRTPQQSTTQNSAWPAASVSNDPPADSAAIKQEHDNIALASIPAAPEVERKPPGPPRQSVCAADTSFWVQAEAFDSADLNYQAAIAAAVLGQIGERPTKPARPGVNPFLLYTKAKWDEVKAFCASSEASAGRDMIRQTIGKWWRAASDEEKQPYIAQSQAAQEAADALRKDWERKSQVWDESAKKIRAEYVVSHPPPLKGAASGAGFMGVSKRKTNVSNCVVLDHS